MFVEVLRSACLCVCLFVCSHAYLKIQCPNFLLVLPVAVAWSSSDGSAVFYVLTILWMLSCFHIMGPKPSAAVRHYVSSILPGSSTRSKSAVSDCSLFTYEVKKTSVKVDSG